MDVDLVAGEFQHAEKTKQARQRNPNRNSSGSCHAHTPSKLDDDLEFISSRCSAESPLLSNSKQLQSSVNFERAVFKSDSVINSKFDNRKIQNIQTNKERVPFFHLDLSPTANGKFHHRATSNSVPIVLNRSVKKSEIGANCLLDLTYDEDLTIDTAHTDDAVDDAMVVNPARKSFLLAKSPPTGIKNCREVLMSETSSACITSICKHASDDVGFCKGLTPHRLVSTENEDCFVISGSSRQSMSQSSDQDLTTEFSNTSSKLASLDCEITGDNTSSMQGSRCAKRAATCISLDEETSESTPCSPASTNVTEDEALLIDDDETLDTSATSVHSMGNDDDNVCNRSPVFCASNKPITIADDLVIAIPDQHTTGASNDNLQDVVNLETDVLVENDRLVLNCDNCTGGNKRGASAYNDAFIEIVSCDGNICPRKEMEMDNDSLPDLHMHVIPVSDSNIRLSPTFPSHVTCMSSRLETATNKRHHFVDSDSDSTPDLNSSKMPRCQSPAICGTDSIVPECARKKLVQNSSISDSHKSDADDDIVAVSLFQKNPSVPIINCESDGSISADISADDLDGITGFIEARGARRDGGGRRNGRRGQCDARSSINNQSNRSSDNLATGAKHEAKCNISNNKTAGIGTNVVDTFAVTYPTIGLTFEGKRDGNNYHVVHVPSSGCTKNLANKEVAIETKEDVPAEDVEPLAKRSLVEYSQSSDEDDDDAVTARVTVVSDSDISDPTMSDRHVSDIVVSDLHVADADGDASSKYSSASKVCFYSSSLKRTPIHPVDTLTRSPPLPSRIGTDPKSFYGCSSSGTSSIFPPLPRTYDSRPKRRIIATSSSVSKSSSMAETLKDSDTRSSSRQHDGTDRLEISMDITESSLRGSEPAGGHVHRYERGSLPLRHRDSKPSRVRTNIVSDKSDVVQIVSSDDDDNQMTNETRKLSASELALLSKDHKEPSPKDSTGNRIRLVHLKYSGKQRPAEWLEWSERGLEIILPESEFLKSSSRLKFDATNVEAVTRTKSRLVSSTSSESSDTGSRDLRTLVVSLNGAECTAQLNRTFNLEVTDTGEIKPRLALYTKDDITDSTHQNIVNTSQRDSKLVPLSRSDPRSKFPDYVRKSFNSITPTPSERHHHRSSYNGTGESRSDSKHLHRDHRNDRHGSREKDSLSLHSRSNPMKSQASRLTDWLRADKSQASTDVKSRTRGATMLAESERRRIEKGDCSEDMEDESSEVGNHFNAPIAVSIFKRPIIKLFTYPPPPAVGAITVTNEDLFCLNAGEYVNDVIIDFYLTYILNEMISEADRKRTHIFSSFFYTQLTSVSSPDVTPGSTLEKTRHSKIKTWTKNIDIFSKDFIIVPINESAHWFLVIICFPGCVKPTERKNEISATPATCESDATTLTTAQNSDKSKSQDEKEDNSDISSTKPVPDPPANKTSSILIFDSLKTDARWDIARILRDYIQVEWDVKQAATVGQREFSKTTLKGNMVKCPQQNNSTDCGPYLLHYVEMFFKRPPASFDLPIAGLVNWFPANEVKSKRKDLCTLILDLTKRLNPTLDYDPKPDGCCEYSEKDYM